MAMMDVKGYVTAIVTGLVGVVVAANLITPLLNATGSTGIGILSDPIVGTIVGAFKPNHIGFDSKESCLSYSDLTYHPYMIS